RVEDAKTSARARADVKEMAALRQRGHDELDRALDLGYGAPHHGGHGRVLVVEELEDLACRHGREAARLGIARFGPLFHYEPHARRIARRAAPIAGSSRTGSTVARGSITSSSLRTARSSEGSDSKAPPAR